MQPRQTSRFRSWLLSAGLVAVFIVPLIRVAAADGDGLLSIGDKAPDFTATAHTGEEITLSKLKSKYVVLYFYPADDTPGCTKEACELRDNWSQLSDMDVRVIGVSTQSNESHRAFAEKYSLPFPLLPDREATIADKYGVPVRLGFASRVTFLIAQDGTIAHIWPKVKPVGHAAQIIEQIKAL